MDGSQYNPEMIYPDLSYAIIGAAMEVHRELGAGWDEWDYHRSLIEALRQKDLSVKSHIREDLVFYETVADQFELDLLVNDSIILELKHMRSGFHPTHYVQILNYLKRWEKRLGILINFGLPSLAYKRLPFTVEEARVFESGKWKELNDREPALCSFVKHAVNDIIKSVGYGYGVNTFRSLLIIALRHLGLIADQLILNPEFNQLTLGNRQVDCIVLNSNLLISISATGKNASLCDLTYLRSYMKKSSIDHGILIDIGSAEILLRGVL